MAVALAAFVSGAWTSKLEAVENLASAQQQFANLGQLLNAGGKVMSPQQFKDEVIQRLLVGMLPSGAEIEMLHASSGMVAGSLLSGGTTQSGGGGIVVGRGYGAPQNWPVSGRWSIDDSDRICASLQITWGQGT